MREPVAIVGIGCRFPGANSPGALWDLLLAGRDATGPIPADRTLLRACVDSPATERDRIPDRGGFLDDIEGFDAARFRFSAREAYSTDPAHRLMLHVVAEALEDGGLAADQLRGTRVPIFCGVLGNDYASLLLADADTFDLYGCVNTTFGALPGRVAHCFDWSGPAVGLDTACSSSLVALQLACQSLQDGTAEVAIAGGVNLVMLPEFSLAFARARMLAPDGHCKAFDASGDGFVRSEGVAAVVLEPLSVAQKKGHPIYAVIRGVHLNHDGGTGQYKTPNRAAQKALLRDAYSLAGVSPLDVQYVEAHGTGTRAGDPVEAGSLADVLCVDRRRDQALRVGSVKTNIGHCEAAAGMAGVIKTALALRHRVIPGNLHFTHPNPKIPWDTVPLTVPTAAEPWPVAPGETARAGVSAFGLTGVNAHVVMESAPAESTPADAPGAALWVMSGGDGDRLRATAAAVAEGLRGADLQPAAVARVLAKGRSRGHARAAIWGDDTDEMRAALAGLGRGELGPTVVMGEQSGAPPRVAFVFPGQGGQWIGMGRQLLAESGVFAQSMGRIAAVMRAEGGPDPLVELARPDDAHRLAEIAVVQPVLFAMQVALAELWMSLGLRPGAVIGHSMGEVAAAHVAGVLDLRDAVAVICRRSQLMSGVSGQGGMLVVGLDCAGAELLVARAPDRVSVAVSNSPRSTVLSGAPDVLQEIAAELDGRAIFSRFVQVDVASHSPQMDPLKGAMLAGLADVQGRKLRVPMYSTVRRRFGRRPEDAAGFDASYWWENLRSSVRFGDAVADALREGVEVFVELNPHALLCQAVRQSDAATPGLMALCTMMRGEDERVALLRTTAELFVRGVSVDLDALVGDGPLVRLPVSPLRSEPFPVDYSRYSRRGVSVGGGTHPLLTSELLPVERPDELRWSVRIDATVQRLWVGHQVQGQVVFPGAGFVDLMLSIGRRALDGGPVQVGDVRFEHALFLPDAGPVDLQVVARQTGDRLWSVVVYGLDGAVHATGDVAASDGPSLSHGVPGPARGQDASAAFYGWMAALGLDYSGAFRRIDQVRYGDGWGEASIGASQGVMLAGFVAHPATLDVCFQSAFSTMLGLREAAPALYLPTGVKSLRVIGELSAATTVRVWRRAGAPVGAFDVDMQVCDAAGAVLVEVEGLSAARLDGARDGGDGLPSLWQQTWQARPLVDPAFPDALERRSWLVRTDVRGVGERVARLLEQQGCRVWRVQRSLRAADRFAILGPRSFRVRAAHSGDLEQLLDHLAHAADGAVDGVLDFWPLLESPLDAASAEEVGTAVQRVCVPVVQLVQVLSARGLTPRVWLFTRDGWTAARGRCAQAAARSALWGLGRVIALEHPELACTLIDLGEGADPSRALLDELVADSGERELRFQGGVRSVGRLGPVADDEDASGAEVLDPMSEPAPFRLEWADDGALVVGAAAVTEPQAGEVQVEICAVDLCAPAAGEAHRVLRGTHGAVVGGVVSVGGHGLSVGDRVVWLGAARGLQSVCALSADQLWRLPDAAFLPEVVGSVGPYLAAVHGLLRVAGLDRGDRVLVSGPAADALAAAHVARWSRADVVVVVPGGDDGRFAAAGFRDVFDAQGAGLSVALEQRFHGGLADVLMIAGDDLADPLSRWLIDGGRCVWTRGAGPARPPAIDGNQALYSVSVEPLLARADQGIMASLARVQTLLDAGTLPVLRPRSLSIDEALGGDGVDGPVVLAIAQARRRLPTVARVVRPDATYLITGGLGGLGLRVALALVDEGARSLVLIGRSAPGPAALDAIADLVSRGAVVRALQADVGRRGDLERVLGHVRERLPPLAGVVHCAGVLADAILLRQDTARFGAVLPAKVHGAWNLHVLTRALPLEMFVVFSSAAGLLGSPGQANYAAANTFLDALVTARRAAGLPGVSIQWGPWDEVGLAARPDRGGRLRDRGLPGFSPEEGAACFLRALELGQPVVAAMRFAPGAWQAAHPGAGGDPRFEGLVHSPAKVALVGVLGGETGGPVVDPLTRLRTVAARVLRVPEARVDTGASLTAQGLDSLMMIELRQAIQADLGVDIPMAQLLKGASLADLAGGMAPVAAAGTPDVLGRLVAITAQVLRVPEQRVDPAASLTAQGLDSLMMIELRQAAQSQLGVDIPMALLLKGVGLGALAAAVAGPAAASAVASPAGIARDLALAPSVRAGARVSAEPVRTVLLTGATGHLGRHLLMALLHGGVERVICLVRASSAAAGLTRLRDRLGAALTPALAERVHVVVGDLARPAMGMGDAAWGALVDSADALVLNGAAVNFEQPYVDLRDTNVVSWRDALGVAAERGTPVHLVSTWAVFSSGAHAGQPVAESDWPRALPSGGYRQTKFVAEGLARQAIERGISVQVHRPALVGAHSETGEHNPRELFGALLRAVVETGVAPELDLRVPFAPVDRVAAGIAEAVLRGAPLPHALHWAAREPIAWLDILARLEAAGRPIQRVTYAGWRAHMRALGDAANIAPFLRILPMELDTEAFGYVAAGLSQNQPAPFENTRTAGAFPDVFAGLPAGPAALDPLMRVLLAALDMGKSGADGLG